MSINWSTPLNDSDQFPALSSISSTYFICYNSLTASYIISAFAATNFLLLFPLYILVLYVGFQRWRGQRSTSMKTATSHADVITYHMVAIEIFSLIGSGFYCSGCYMKNIPVMMVGFYTFSIIFPGQNLFHCLTCVEHYLAVVHPITYLGLKKERGARIRNISIGCVWLMCVGWMGVSHVYLPDIPVLPFFFFFASSLFVSSLCSFSILCALAHTSPGEGGRGRGRVDQSKQRAFQTIMAIMGTLLLRFAGLICCLVTYRLVLTAGGDPCVMLGSGFWVGLPSSLVLPLLFIQRAGKLSCCTHNAESR